MEPMKVFRFALLLAVTCGAIATHAQTYPSRPIRVVVGYAPGGASDIVFRNVQEEWSQQLGQPLVAEYKPGANGSIANDFLASAPPDGYTILWTNVGPHVLNGLLAPQRTDPATFVPVAQVTESALVVVVPAKSPYRTIQDLLGAAKAKPGGLTYGTPGNGSPMHLAGAQLSIALGAPMTQVPYKGSAPALADLMAGQFDFMADSRASTAPLIRDGRLRALAVTSAQRVPELPQVPTVTESGVPGYSVTTWVGVVAPAGTPGTVVEKLSSTLRAALRSPAVRARYAQSSTDVVETSTTEFARSVDTQRLALKALVDKLKIKAD
jgi:tripartite-type tricarboxylate transporter receptor subunit TctC